LSTPEGLFDALMQSSPAQPFVTYYDEASGERSELSVKSLANWVAKTHFLLTDELGLGVGDSALITLPAHWISVAPLLGVLSAGLAVTESPLTASVAFVDPSTVAAADGVPDVYCIAPDSAAVGLRGAQPEGTEDYVLSVRPQADKWSTVRSPGSPADDCWAGLSRGEVVTLARSRADELGLGSGGRLLTARSWSGPADWLDTVLAPLAVGGSVVFVRNAADESVLTRRADQERATVIV